MKKLLSILLSAIVLCSGLAAFSLTAAADKLDNKNHIYYRLTDEGAEVTGFDGKTTSVTIPSKLEGKKVIAISEKAFANSAKLKSVKISSSVTTIGKKAFKGCRNLSAITLPKKLTKISDEAFSCCYKLKLTKLPESLEYIGRRAFLFCKAITAVKLPDSVKELGEGCFSCCFNLKSFTIGKGVSVIPEDAFEFCSLSSISVPDNVERIEKNAFRDTSLKTLKIGKGLVFIHHSNLHHSKYLKKITVSSGNKHFTAADGILYNKNKTLLRYCLRNAGSAEFKIPSGVKKIEAFAFMHNKQLETLEVPESVKTIKHDAFYGCKKLKTATIPANVTEIGNCAFFHCAEKLVIKGEPGSAAEAYVTDFNKAFNDDDYDGEPWEINYQITFEKI